MKSRLTVCLLFFIFVCCATSISAQCVGAVGKLSVDTSNLDFGDVEIGTGSEVLFFTISNLDSESEMEVLKIQPQNSRFKIVESPSIPFCLDPFSEEVIGVQFFPLQTGTPVSKIRIETTAGVAFVGIKGTGIEGSGGGDDGLKVSPSSLNFGEVEVGKKSSKTFKITNQGESSETISKINSSNSAFRITSPSFPRSLGGGDDLTVSVEFTPSKEGSFSGNLSIITGSSTAASVSVDGEGIGKAGEPDISFSPQTLAYGNMDMGTFKTQVLTISNSGNDDLELTLPSDSLLSTSPSGSLKIQPNKSAQITVKFIADLVGSINRKYTIPNNDPDEARAQITITANGQKGLFGFVDRTVRSKIAGNPNKTSAVQLIDFDKDGKEDLYLTGFDGNLMCKNTGGAVFANSTNQNKLGNNGSDARGVTWGDVDNDGDLDAFIANFNAPSSVLKNNQGVFADQSGSLGIFATDNTPKSQGGLWLDFNHDSRIDLFIVKDGAQNQLFKNVGGFQFANVANSAGVAFKGPGRGAVSADFNNDGFVDLYVVNFQRPNKMYFNNGNETFRDVTASAQVGFSGASQHAAAVDYDGDEDIDIFVVNNNGASLLYRNQGNGKFQNVAGAAGLAGPKKGKAASFSDLDHDGDIDVVFAQTEGGNFLFANVNGRFTRVTNVDLSNADDPTSTTVGDTDNDGDVDIAIGDGDGGADSGDSVFQNTGGGNNNWIILTLQGSASNRSAIGAKVIVRTGIIIQAAVVSAGNGRTQDTLPLEFGLGGATAADIIIVWPSGRQQSMTGVAGNRKVTITEPAN